VRHQVEKVGIFKNCRIRICTSHREKLNKQREKSGGWRKEGGSRREAGTS
jgi:hypothetical protein